MTNHDGPAFNPSHAWQLSEPDYPAQRRLSQELLLTPVVAQILINRSLCFPAESFAFLFGVIHHDPYLFHDMEKAVERIRRALDSGESIFIYGDYDVDGITGTALLTDYLRRLGGVVSYKVPHRLEDGYDLSPREAEEAANDGHTLIITNDCGVTAHEAVARARNLGVDVVITDHHLPDDTLPQANAVINASVPGSGYPFKGLAGVTTVYKLVSALHRHYPEGPDPDEYLDLVALGTVADVCPLINENRSLVVNGLARLNRLPRLGLAALVDSAHLGGRRITAKHLSYVLAPRLNAAGRISTADVGVELLLTDDAETAHRLATRIEGLNRRRRSIEAETTRKAMAMAEDDLALEDIPVLVVGDPDWHPGVVGIVAARLADRFNRPAMVFGEHGRGSARGYGDFDIIGTLDRCAELLNEYGGHRHAAGVRIQFKNLNAIRRRVNAVAREDSYDKRTRLEVDAVVELDQLSENLMCELEILEPFGIGNAEPLFLARNVEPISKPQVVGKNHLKMILGSNGASVEAIAFNMADLIPQLPPETGLDVLFNLERHPLKGRSGLQMRIVDLAPAAAVQTVEYSRKLHDLRGKGDADRLMECVESCDAVIYTWPDDREELQRHLARRGWLPAAAPEMLDGRHYIFWDTLANQPTPSTEVLNLCLWRPLDGLHELLVLRELTQSHGRVNLYLLFDKARGVQPAKHSLDRVRLAEIWRNLPEEAQRVDELHGLYSDNGSPGELRLALSIFLELGLMESRNGNYQKRPVQDRRDLTRSFTYQRIRACDSRRRRFIRQQLEFQGAELERLYFESRFCDA